MDDRYARLESAVGQLLNTVELLQHRVAALESDHRQVADSAAEGDGAGARGVAPGWPAVARPKRDPYDPIVVLSLIGRLFLVLAGGFFLRAMTEAGVLAPAAGVALAFVSQLVRVATASSTMGGFRVTVSPAASGNPQERDIVAVGWVPTDVSSDTRTKAHQRITVTVMDFRVRPLDMPCALCVRGDVQVGGNSTISAREDTSCGNRYGTWSTRVLDSNGNVVSPGNTDIQSGASHIYGADGNSTPDQATDMAQQQDQAVRLQQAHQ